MEAPNSSLVLPDPDKSTANIEGFARHKQDSLDDPQRAESPPSEEMSHKWGMLLNPLRSTELIMA